MPRRKKLIRTALVLTILIASALAFLLGQRLVTLKAQRGPASVPDVFIDLHGTALDTAIKRRLIQEAKSFTRTGVFGVELGQFATRDESGRVFTACELYPRIRIRYVAGDMAVNGVYPSLIVEGDCETDGSSNYISPLLIPYGEMKKEPPVARQYPELQTFGNSVRTENIVDAWPEVWLLEQIDMIDGTGHSKVTVQADEIRAYRNGNALEIK